MSSTRPTPDAQQPAHDPDRIGGDANPKIASCSARSPVRTRPRLLTRSLARASAGDSRRSCVSSARSRREAVGPPTGIARRATQWDGRSVQTRERSSGVRPARTNAPSVRETPAGRVSVFGIVGLGGKRVRPKGGRLSSTGPRRERVLPVEVDSRRSTSTSDSRSASCRIGACVQRAQSNDRAWSTRVVRDRSVTNLRVGALGASFDLRNNATCRRQGRSPVLSAGCGGLIQRMRSPTIPVRFSDRRGNDLR